MEIFEIGRWIESHKSKYDMSNSGMGKRIDIKKYLNNYKFRSENEVKEVIANLYSIDSKNISLTHGATEGYSIYLFIKRDSIKCKYILPEYELLFKVPKIFNIENGDVICLSNPHNPTGEFFNIDERSIIDETFLFFYEDPYKIKYKENIARINTFTKFFGDEIRLGWIISNETNSIEGLRGIIFERVSSINLGIAYEMLKDYDNIKDYLRSISKDNLNYIKKNMGRLKFYNGSNPVPGTVVFIDYSYYTNLDSVTISEMLHKHDISVVPSIYFGVNGNYIRISYTSENFKEGFDQLLNFFENI